MQRRHFIHILLSTSALAFAATTLSLSAPLDRAQAARPTKPVRIVAAGPAGGSADMVARVIADVLSKQTGQTVIVEPKPGAGGVLAVDEVSLAPRDGSTLLVGVNSLVSKIPHIVKLNVDMAAEIKPLAEVARGDLVMVGNPSLLAKTLPR